MYNDLPLGNPVGIPYDRGMQRQTIAYALDLLETAKSAGEVFETPFKWSESETWKRNFFNVVDRDPDELLRLGEENRQERRRNKEQGLSR